jgi:4-amino-4-deoxy-L-arabinose transferase-like glycosyltransferase
MRVNSQRLWVFGVFALALTARLVYLIFFLHGSDVATTMGGADCYGQIAANLIQGHGYSCSYQAPYVLNSMRPPLMSFMLAGGYMLAHSYWFPALLQVILGSLIPVIAMALAQSLVASQRVSRSLGVLLALEPNGILFSVGAYSETLFTFFFLLAVYVLVRAVKVERTALLLLSGFLFGLATLTKPTSEYLPVLIALILAFYYRATLRHVALPLVSFVCIFLLTLSPWLYRNWHEFGVLDISPQAGEQLNMVLVPSVLAYDHGTSFTDEFSDRLRAGGVDPNSASVAHSSDYLHQALPILRAHPVALVAVSANTAVSFFTHDGVSDFLLGAGVTLPAPLGKPLLMAAVSHPIQFVSYLQSAVQSPLVATLIARILWILITALMFFGMYQYIRIEKSSRVLGFLLATFIAYFMLTTLVIGYLVNARYRLPVNALVLFFAVYAGDAILKIVQKWRTSR